MAGRPRSFDRAAALDTAVKQFWRSGYEQTTVATLTAAMGITAPSLYAAFGDKDALFAEAADCYAARIGAALDRALAQPSTRASIAELLRATAAAHTSAATPPGCFVLTEPRLAEYREQLRGRIRDRLARGRAEGDLPAGCDPELLASFLVAVMAGMSMRARDGAAPGEVDAIAATALAAIPAA